MTTNKLDVDEEEDIDGEILSDQDEDLDGEDTDTDALITGEDDEELIEGEIGVDEELVEGEIVEEELIEGDDEMMSVAQGAPSTPVQVQLFMSQPPVVGAEARIMMEITTAADAPKVNASLELPPGVKVVSGDTSWEGSLDAGESAKFSATIVFEQPGEYTISGIALAPINQDMVYGDQADVFLTIGMDSSHFGLESGGDAQLDTSTNP